MIKLLFSLLLTATAGYSFSQPLQEKVKGLMIDSSSKNIMINCGCGNKRPHKILYILDGKILDSPNLSGINPNDIETFQILKSGLAAKLFGEKAIGGVIIIGMKEKGINSKDQKDSTNPNNFKPAIRDYTIKSPKQPFFMIDGVPQDSVRFVSNNLVYYSGGKSQVLFPGNITASELLTDSRAAAIYGVPGASGVVIVSTN